MGRIVAAPHRRIGRRHPRRSRWRCRRRRGIPTSSSSTRLACAAAVGYLITRNATVSGAEGAARPRSARRRRWQRPRAWNLKAARRAVFERRRQRAHQHDGPGVRPGCGLVEVPCQKRNASGAATALVSAQTSLAGIGNLVGFDQTVEGLCKVGAAFLRAARIGPGRLGGNPDACAWCESHMSGSRGHRAGLPRPYAKPARTGAVANHRGSQRERTSVSCSHSATSTCPATPSVNTPPSLVQQKRPQTTEVCGALPYAGRSATTRSVAFALPDFDDGRVVFQQLLRLAGLGSGRRACRHPPS